MSGAATTALGVGEAAGSTDEVQKGLAEMRSYIQRTHMPLGGQQSGPPATTTSQDVAASQVTIARMGDIEYRIDPIATAEDRSRRTHRTAKVKCAFCGAHTDVHQTKPIDGEWGPDALKTIALIGWQPGRVTEDAGTWFCGKTCLERREYKRIRDKEGVPLAQAVRQIGPPSAARLAYQTTSIVVADAQRPGDVAPGEFTPAVPPQTAAAPVRKIK